jgi:hypothetical protein
LLEDCWQTLPADRPEASQAVAALASMQPSRIKEPSAQDEPDNSFLSKLQSRFLDHPLFTLPEDMQPANMLLHLSKDFMVSCSRNNGCDCTCSFKQL